MSSKQDRIGARTPTDIERKYDLGSMNANFAEVMGVATDARNIAEEAKAQAEEASKPLTKEEVFNSLTGNGTEEGLFYSEDGNVYINATYIKSGELNGDLLKVGTIKSKDGTLSIDLENGVLDAFGGLATNGLKVRSEKTGEVNLFEVSSFQAAGAPRVYVNIRTANGNGIFNVTESFKTDGTTVGGVMYISDPLGAYRISQRANVDGASISYTKGNQGENIVTVDEMGVTIEADKFDVGQIKDGIGVVKWAKWEEIDGKYFLVGYAAKP